MAIRLHCRIFVPAFSQSPGLLQTLQRTAAEPEDIFYVNFGRWHFSNCRGLEVQPYTQALRNLGKLYQV
jgi:hypothetical protein